MSTAVFGVPGFKARSGRLVKPQEDGSIRFGLGLGYLGRLEAMDADEYFQAKRDQELGRWRWPENPDYVVRSIGADMVRVLQESTLDVLTAHRADVQSFEPEGVNRGLYKAAWAFFEAHPERAWEDGVYVATGLNPTTSKLYKRRNGSWRDAEGFDLPGFDPIAGGRRLVRLVPEDAS